MVGSMNCYEGRCTVRWFPLMQSCDVLCELFHLTQLAEKYRSRALFLHR